MSVASLIRNEVMNGQKRTTTEKLTRITCWMATAHRLYRLLRPPRLIELYLSLWICSCHWAEGCREDESSRDLKPETEFCAGSDSGGRSAEGNHETDPWTSEKTGEEFKRAVVLAIYYLSRTPRAAERGFRVIGPEFGECERHLIIDNSRQISGSDGERASCRTMVPLLLLWLWSSVCEPNAVWGAQDPEAADYR